MMQVIADLSAHASTGRFGFDGHAFHLLGPLFRALTSISSSLRGTCTRTSSMSQLSRRNLTFPDMLRRCIHGASRIRFDPFLAYRRYYSTGPCPDLRILFCGSDNFSVTSLETLNRARGNRDLPITSIDVLCRPPKRTGRGLKNVKEVPIVDAASRLNLPVHKIDTFKGWTLPEDGGINLIVAVSFGLLIPARIIRSAAYGGLNVHPSLLPDFRGAAPIEHAIFENCTETGVSLQTLHPTKFDHGELLRQCSSVMNPPEEDMVTIKARLAEQGAQLLVNGIRSGDFLDPVRTVKPFRFYKNGAPVQERKAPKISAEDSHINWQWSPDQVLLRQKVLGPLWTQFQNDVDGTKLETRIKWTGGFKKVDTEAWDPAEPGPIWSLDSKTGSLIFPTANGTGLEIERFTLAGKAERTVKEARQILKITDESSTRYL